MKRNFLALGVVLLFCGRASTACTTFSFMSQKQIWMANSLDWFQDHGQVIINVRNVRKKALLVDNSLKALEWTSKYGSLTFNQHGREFPLGGINERGLTVETMWLDSSVYEPADGRPSVNELQWMQYQLDVSQNISEAIQNARAVRVVRVAAPQHYMICDASQACATFEFVDGKLVVHSGTALPVRALTNNTYDESVAYLANVPTNGSHLPFPNNPDSLARFANAFWWIHHIPADQAIPDFSFAGLKNVAQGDYSKWNLVYRLDDPRVYFRTLNAQGIKTTRLSSFLLECETKPSALVMDINSPVSGEVTKLFTPYRQAANEAMVKKSFDFIVANFGGGLTPEVIEKVAKYPTTLTCGPREMVARRGAF